MDIDACKKAGYIWAQDNGAQVLAGPPWYMSHEAFSKVMKIILACAWPTDADLVAPGEEIKAGDWWYGIGGKVRTATSALIGTKVNPQSLPTFRPRMLKWSCGHGRDATDPYCYVCKGWYNRTITACQKQS